MKKLILSAVMLVSIASFAVNPAKQKLKVKKAGITVFFDGEGKYAVECGSVKATFEACSNTEAVTIANRICPGINIIEIVQAPKPLSIQQ